MKSLVIGRKNWLFSTSPAGAEATAIWMTLIESAKANNIDPRDYITCLLEKMPQLPEFPKKEELKAYLPWNFDQAISGRDETTITAQSMVEMTCPQKSRTGHLFLNYISIRSVIRCLPLKGGV